MVATASAASNLTQWWRPEAETLAIASSLAVISLFMLLGSFWHRPKLGVAAGIMASILLAGTLTLPNFTPEGPTGEVVYASSEQVPSSVNLTMRQTTLDLSGVHLEDTRTIRVVANASQVTIKVPKDYAVEYRLRAANLILQNGEEINGSTEGSVRPLSDRPTLTVLIIATASQVEVQ